MMTSYMLRLLSRRGAQVEGLAPMAPGRVTEGAGLPAARRSCDRRPMKIVIAAAVTLAVGCGSSRAASDGGAGGAPGDGATGVCRANTPAGASVSWLEDGVPK